MSVSPAPRSPSPVPEPPKLNKYGKPKKCVRWEREERLEAVRYFECEEGERGKNETGFLIHFISYLQSGQRKDYYQYCLLLCSANILFLALTCLFESLQVFPASLGLALLPNQDICSVQES